MLTAQGETYRFDLYKRIENSSYQWEESPKLYFFGRPANQMEKRHYRIQEGVSGSQDSVYIYATRLPADLKIKDKVLYLGKMWTVGSVGYYFENSNMVNGRVFSPEYIIKRCAKGFTLE